MINFGNIDPSKNSVKVLPEKLVIVDDEECENQTMRNIIKASSQIIPNEDRSFMIFDFGSIMNQYTRIRTLIPRVYPFFAIKCMADKQIISLLGSLGAGFDCASWDEINNASSVLPKPIGTFSEKYHPINSEKIIFSHPFKFSNEMTKASKIGVEFTVFDTKEELISISSNWPQSKLLLRILPSKIFKAYAQLGKKFGAEKNEMKSLISFAKQMKLNLVGVCFHVGSGVEEMDSWSQSIEYSAQVFRLMEEDGFKPYLLDIGGGFPSRSMININKNNEKQIEFENECQNINLVLDKYFPSSENYVIICEPGAYFTSGAGCIICQIIGKTEDMHDIDQSNINNEIYSKVKYSYILNNSSYHSVEFNSPFEVYSVKEFNRKNKLINLQSDVPEDVKINCRFLGYTVDEFDILTTEIQIPELFVNDWVMIIDKGAYSDVHNDLPTTFCSSTSIPHYYCISKKHLVDLKKIILNSAANNDSILKLTDRNNVFDKISDSCFLM